MLTFPHRCLVDGKTGSSSFLPRNQSSSLVLQLQTFRFAADQEVNASTLVCAFNFYQEFWFMHEYGQGGLAMGSSRVPGSI